MVRDEQVPAVEREQDDDQGQVQHREEGHQADVFLLHALDRCTYEERMVPHERYTGEAEDHRQLEVEQEKQKESKVLHANAVVYPRAVVVHVKDAVATCGAVMRPRWLDLIALITRLIPDSFKIGDRFSAIAQQSLDVL